MTCRCKEWGENIGKVNAPLMLQSARSGYRVHYDGVRFRYCPWCGEALVDASFDSESTDSVFQEENP